MTDWTTQIIAVVGAATALFLAVVGLSAVRFRAVPGDENRRRLDEMERRIWDRTQAEIARLNQKISRIEMDNAELTAWVRALVDQVISFGGVPVPRPHLYRDAAPAIDGLYDCLRTRFSAGELETLAHDAGLAWDESGAAGQPQPVAALRLYEYAERLGRLAQLVEAARRARPGVDV